MVELPILYKVQPTPVHIVGLHPESSGLSYYSVLSVLMFCMGGLQCELQYTNSQRHAIGKQVEHFVNLLVSFTGL